jgi:hypothetical protein
MTTLTIFSVNIYNPGILTILCVNSLHPSFLSPHISSQNAPSNLLCSIDKFPRHTRTNINEFESMHILTFHDPSLSSSVISNKGNEEDI